MSISGFRSGRVAVPLLAGSLFIAGAIGAGGASAAPTRCDTALAAFDRDVKAGTADAVGKSYEAVLDETDCTTRQSDEARARHILFLIDYAGKHPAEAAEMLGQAENEVGTLQNWRVKARLADYYWDHRSDKEALAKAYHWYQESIAAFSTADPRPTAAEMRVVRDRVGATGLLVYNDQEGTTRIPPPKTRDAFTGKLGGIYSPEFHLRTGATLVERPDPVPIAVQFFTNETRFTPVGEQALGELAEALKDVNALELVGHADPRIGQRSPKEGRDYNMRLSCDRVAAVQAALKKLNVTATIKTSCKGDTQPYDTSRLDHPETLSDQEKWQLDRRVEATW